MEKPLTFELIQQKTKCDNLATLTKLNLWGNDLSDLSILYQMPNLEILSLSLNYIRSLKYFTNCKKLSELFLRKNSIMDLSEINYLRDLSNLKNLWLSENPCASTPNYRMICIKCLPQLIKLDNQTITNEEKIASESINLETIFNSNEEPGQTLTYSSDQQISQPFVSSLYQSQQPKQPQQLPFFPQQQQQQPAFLPQQQQQQLAFLQPTSTLLTQNQQTCFQKTNLIDRNEDERNENILCAVLALIKELDQTSLEILQKNVGRRLGKIPVLQINLLKMNSENHEISTLFYNYLSL